MKLSCTECGYYAFAPLGDVAVYFAYRHIWDCPNCGAEIIFDIKECLEFSLGVWRN
jgi:predicted RNA-binding Zn-ribbon protein involved in translation (DUF1610 family)